MMKLYSITVMSLPDGRYVVDYVRLRDDNTKHKASFIANHRWGLYLKDIIPIGWCVDVIGRSIVYSPPEYYEGVIIPPLTIKRSNYEQDTIYTKEPGRQNGIRDDFLFTVG